jgi:hypothetical protein
MYRTPGNIINYKRFGHKTITRMIKNDYYKNI